jgi:hypothetical protein
MELKAAGFEAYATADNNIQCITDSSKKLSLIHKIVGGRPTKSHYANGKIYVKIS